MGNVRRLSCKYHAITMQSPCKDHANIMQSRCALWYANSTRISCKYHVNYHVRIVSPYTGVYFPCESNRFHKILRILRILWAYEIRMGFVRFSRGPIIIIGFLTECRPHKNSYSFGFIWESFAPPALAKFRAATFRVWGYA